MSNIKDRILLIAKWKKINRIDFFKDLGLSYANFKGAQKQSSLSSDAVATILAKHIDINPSWLITGEGSMLREDVSYASDKQENYKAPKEEIDTTEDVPAHVLQKVIWAQVVTIRSQEKTILSLEKQLELLNRELTLLQKDL